MPVEKAHREAGCGVKARKCTHGVPWCKGGAVVGCKLILGEVFPVDDDLIDVFREPIVGHKVIAVMAVVFAPAILDAPKRGLPLAVEVYSLKHHRVCHKRFAIIESSRFVQACHHRHAEQPVGIHGTDTHHAVARCVPRLLLPAPSPYFEVSSCLTHVRNLS